MDRFLIAPINTGLQSDLKPWQIMDDAFQLLENAYVFRGRVRKRFGSLLMGDPPTVNNSRLRINLGNTGASPSTTNLPGTPLGAGQLAIGQQFTVGNTIFTVYQLGAGVATLTTNPAITATIDSTVNPNTITITGAGVGVAVYYYPSNPVMGLTQYEVGAVNNQPAFAFDTEFAYRFTGPGWERSGTAFWRDPSGNQLNYFWAYNYRATIGSNTILFVTNFQVTNLNGAGSANDDPIWWLDSSTGTDVWTPASGVNAFYLAPNGGAIQTGPYVVTALMIVAFHGRLILLNTVENDNSGGVGVNFNFKNRARFSAIGDPFAVNAWYEENQTDGAGNFAIGAGFEDAATEEKIIGCEFIKDHLIVYFERSTWELVYTYSEARPFIWRKLNTELGSQSTFSTVPFDTQILAIGNTGVHSCNGSNVARIDQKIPDKIFEFESSSTQRTAGIRDYYSETVYWTYVSDIRQSTQRWPTNILVYNYRNGSWAENDDCITTFGYFEQQQDTTWASSAPTTWETFEGSWIDGVLQSNQRQILAGTPEGFVVRIARDVSRNAPTMQITNMSIAATGIITLTIVNHNLSATPTAFPNECDFILIENVVGSAGVQTFLNGTIFPVFSVVDANTITINTFGGLVAGTYSGGGTAARVSVINILTKQFNPYVSKDRNVYLARVDFAVEKTETGQITVDYFPSASPVSMIAGGVASGSIMGNNILETSPYNPAIYPLEQFQDLLWHPIYFQSSGTFIQLALYFSADQTINPNISLVDFQLEAMTLYTQPTSSRME